MLRIQTVQYFLLTLLPIQVVFGSALCALEGKNPEIGEQSVMQLLQVLDDSFVIPDRKQTTDPMFPAEHVYAIKGKLIVGISKAVMLFF